MGQTNQQRTVNGGAAAASVLMCFLLGAPVETRTKGADLSPPGQNSPSCDAEHTSKINVHGDKFYLIEEQRHHDQQ